MMISLRHMKHHGLSTWKNQTFPHFQFKCDFPRETFPEDLSLFAVMLPKAHLDLYSPSQQKQDQELTVAQIMNFLLQNSDLN